MFEIRLKLEGNRQPQKQLKNSSLTNELWKMFGLSEPENELSILDNYAKVGWIHKNSVLLRVKKTEELELSRLMV